MNTPKPISKNPPLKKYLIILLFALFLLALIWVIVFKCNQNQALHIERNQAMTIWERIDYKIIPFKHAMESIASGSVLELLALIFNVVCFMPFGALLCFLMSRKAAVISAFAFSVGVELFQLLSGWGGLDFADIFLNTLGAVFGVLLYNVLFRKLSTKTVHIIAIVCLALAIPLDIYAFINTMNNFPV